MNIKIKNVTKKIADKIIFENINWQIENKTMVGIKGKSGAGKTTLLNLISLIDQPSSGEIFFNTVNVTNISIKKRRKYLRDDLGFVFQNYGLLENSTIKQNLELSLKAKKLQKKKKIFLMKEVLQQMDLSTLDLYGKVSSLSGGEQQRIGLARCILKNSNVIIADEPTAALDSENEEMIMTQFKKLKESGHTIILTTHSDKYDHYFDELFYL